MYILELSSEPEESAQGEEDEEEEIASAGVRNPTLRRLPSGEYEGTKPELPVDDAQVVFQVEDGLKTYVNAEEKFQRTITNFRFVSSEDENRMVSVGLGLCLNPDQPEVVLLGLAGSANPCWEMGQRLQSGLWWYDAQTYFERPVELAFVRAPVLQIETRKVDWWRDGKYLVTLVWSHRSVYALQGADIPYFHRLANCFLRQDHPLYSRPVDFSVSHYGNNSNAPQWISQEWAPGLIADYRRMMLNHPENTQAPPVPGLSASERQRLKLEGDIASREWQIRYKVAQYEEAHYFIRDFVATRNKAKLEKLKKKRTLKDRLITDINNLRRELQELKDQRIALPMEVIENASLPPAQGTSLFQNTFFTLTEREYLS
ncbi:hypothetical protein BN14_09509 [Rhizoctonia solani AG-1 IB]|uniref:Uncharacterized protein n=1 Tax=Thanatephorus cucumeris (strain AG1-IB / isolate 7/3/14) TaxID=1108050 RepID=M5C7I0_THACB|nr:hypothetical protein BN14_09509 [Rhizoctonia solani AG-1 IB]